MIESILSTRPGGAVAKGEVFSVGHWLRSRASARLMDLTNCCLFRERTRAGGVDLRGGGQEISNWQSPSGSGQQVNNDTSQVRSTMIGVRSGQQCTAKHWSVCGFGRSAAASIEHYIWRARGIK